jgi:hypothetical protein
MEAIRSVNMHQLGVNFVERVLDVRRRHTDGGKAAAPGESLEFIAQIRGLQSEERKKRKAQLLQLNDIGLRVALGHAIRTDVFFIPKAHFAKETPEQGDEGWWYQVRSVIRCRECRQCNVRKESAGFLLNEWRKKQPATCAQCVLEQHVGQASVRASRRASTGKQHVNNRQARRPRAAHKRRLDAGDTASESNEGAAEGADWDECYGVKMSPANPRYVGRGDSTCVGGRWCIPYLRSKYFFVLNQTMRSVG